MFWRKNQIIEGILSTANLDFAPIAGFSALSATDTLDIQNTTAQDGAATVDIMPVGFFA